MDVKIFNSETPPPAPRGYVASMVIRSFKGRRDVEVHLFRPDADPAEAEGLPWDALLGAPVAPGASQDPLASRKVYLEAFTLEERDILLEYIKNRYHDRVTTITAAPMDFPIPLGLPPLSSFPEGKSIGLIRFDKIPNYTLPFNVHGLYDLSRHKPLVDEQE